MADGEREADWDAIAAGLAGVTESRGSDEGGREFYATGQLLRALNAGPQSNPDNEAKRQFTIGYAAGTLGLVRFHQILLTRRKG